MGRLLRNSERALRVVTLADGVTVHNAFPERDFEEEPT
jgi:hypothetical protein